MDTIDGMRTFVTVITEGSFSAAAERLNMSPQLASKYVAQLEARLGARLINRSTRRMSITEAGQAYFERCQYVLAEIDEMESAVGDATTAARGTLRINAPMTFGTMHLSQAIAEYQRGQPDVSVDLTLDDRVVDIVSEGYDMAIRIGRMPESALVARKLAPVRLVVCGSPDYFANREIPRTPDDLAGHECLLYTIASDASRWRFGRGTETHDVRVSGGFSANNGDALRLAALAGRGLVLQPTFIVGEDIRAGRLRQVLEDYEVEPMGVYAVYAHRQYLSGKVRTFVDFLAGYFGSPPFWECG
ncbi:MAG: LysR family transcriptional regulator [Gammaproteobacteria bacterium]|nr:LysR family transcriptional regulator [Gammaproteobacteria bacterium]MBT8104795.1 LysR family transcriptional regulator [Gammaproteobacteria bacterium]NNF50085.1 LysR family transcriptional regulator [Woeseiaceae bacterium]NNK24809.1 LysR family transcriptional regulator [Woeseiaceae bacterium]